METVMMLVTVVSLAAAVAMAMLGWKLLRGDRERSTARVEALESLAVDADDEPDRDVFDWDDDVAADAAPARPDPVITRTSSAPIADLQWDEPSSRDVRDVRDVFDDAEYADAEPVARAAHPRPAIRRPASTSRPRRSRPVAARVSPHRAAGVETAEPMFGATADGATGSGRRWISVAAVALVMVGGAGTAYAVYRPGVLAVGHAAHGAPMAAGQTAPLELLSLRHATEPDGAFTVTGLVQNPTDASTVPDVVAVLFLFDADGNYFASGRAPLDLSSLQPGAESPFVVRVPNAGRVGRYRVGFRLESGAVVAHVNHRGQPLDGTTEGLGATTKTASSKGAL